MVKEKEKQERLTEEYDDEALGVRMTVVTQPSVREQLRYRALMAFGDNGNLSDRAGTYERFWQAARMLIVEWECDALPDKDADLGDVHGRKATDAIIWACNTVSAHLSRVEGVEKN